MYTPAPVSSRTRLSMPELREVCLAQAADRGSWESLLQYAADEHWSVRLHADETHDVWLISWLQSQSTTLHDHGGSSGTFTTVAGALREYLPGGAENEVPVGGLRGFGPRHVHDVYNPCTTPAVSLHVYSPPLTLMSYYDEVPGGVQLARTEITMVPEAPQRGLEELHSFLS